MTIMLLPGGKYLFLTDNMLTREQGQHYMQFVNDFMLGKDVAATMTEIKAIIDARVEPAIKIEVV